MADAILVHFRELINQDMERRLGLNHLLCKIHALTQIFSAEDFLNQPRTAVHDCLRLLCDLAQQAAQANDFALGELANGEHIFN